MRLQIVVMMLQTHITAIFWTKMHKVKSQKCFMLLFVGILFLFLVVIVVCVLDVVR